MFTFSICRFHPAANGFIKIDQNCPLSGSNCTCPQGAAERENLLLHDNLVSFQKPFALVDLLSFALMNARELPPHLDGISEGLEPVKK